MVLLKDDQLVVRFSDLQREPRMVSQAVDRGPVRVTRRDGSPMVLIREEELETTLHGMSLASQIVGAWIAGDPDTAIERLTVAFPWITYLRPHERPECAREFIDTARVCTATEDYIPLVACVNAWQSTAEAYAAGWDHEDIEWLDEPIVVPRPVAAK